MRAVVVSSNVIDATSTKLRAALRARVDPQGPAAVTFDDAERALSRAPAEMLAVVLSPDPERGLELVRKARNLGSGYVLAVGHTEDSRLILRALHDGADQYLDESDLEAGLEAVLSRLQSKEEAAAPAGRLIAVLAASGGSGASTLAVNIATVLAREAGRTALLDLKPGRGDLATLLDLRPSFNLADVCLNAARLDRAMFEKVLIAHASGVHLLAAPQAFNETRLVTPHGVSQALTLARRLFPHVVVDQEDCFHEEQVLTLRQAGVILLVCRLDFTSLRNVRRTLEHLGQIDIPRARVRLVVNRHGQANELPRDEVEEALGGKPAFYVPDDPKTINGANNTGIPAVLKAPAAKVSQTIAQLARDVLERRTEAPAPARAASR